MLGEQRRTTRSDGLPWLFISERDQPLTRQSVNYLVGAAAERRGSGPSTRICCARGMRGSW